MLCNAADGRAEDNTGQELRVMAGPERSIQMLSFRLDYPPSVNHYWRSFRGMVVLSAAGKAYRGAAAEFSTPQPLTGRLAVSLELTMPDRRKRDLDNCCKAILDAIGHAGIWVDDCQIDRLLIQRVGVEPPGCVDVVIEEL